MKFEEAKTVVIGGIIILVCVIAGIYVYTIYTSQFPIDSLECKDGKVFRDQGNVDMFSVRVTNRGSFGVRDIRIRIGFFDTLGNPVDATVVTFPETIPPKSTKLLIKRNIRVSRLPSKWKSTYTILDAKRAIGRGK
ncbi:MAG: hypothetical protein KAJ09_06005 [Deltaproteobacteria bacterium]|nr:hypothetical protein [Deltaproteobacteria bacterium]